MFLEVYFQLLVRLRTKYFLLNSTQFQTNYNFTTVIPIYKFFFSFRSSGYTWFSGRRLKKHVRRKQIEVTDDDARTYCCSRVYCCGDIGWFVFPRNESVKRSWKRRKRNFCAEISCSLVAICQYIMFCHLNCLFLYWIYLHLYKFILKILHVENIWLFVTCMVWFLSVAFIRYSLKITINVSDVELHFTVIFLCIEPKPDMFDRTIEINLFRKKNCT